MYEFSGTYEERLKAAKEGMNGKAHEAPDFSPWQYPDLNAEVENAVATTTVLVN